VKRRVVLCMGQYCNANGQAQALYDRLRAHLGDPVPPFMARGRAVTWEVATCLSLCGGGPNLVIYPDEVWFHRLDLDTLERVIAEYLTV
jgi:(2Fe-2S) ferredoxin